MEKRFPVFAILAGCFVTYLFLPSCSSNKKFTGTPPILKGPINITGYDTSKGTLTLKDDNGTDASNVSVQRKMKVNWNLTSSTQSKIEITAIKSDPHFPFNDPNFFTVAPKPVGSSNHWQAEIEDLDTTKGAIEKYIIQWQLKGFPKTYTFDPLLQLNPH